MLKDMHGMRFGKLLVVERAENLPDGTAAWKCVCDCGEERVIPGTGLRAGRNKSCGCASPRFTSDTLETHGASRMRVYRIWRGMLQRCSRKATEKQRRNYYDKGIRVCERWKRFENFLEDMGHPNPEMSIDRIDGNKGYSKSNCRWATAKEQANNTAANRVISHNGETMTVSQWAEKIGVKPNTLLYRIQRGMALDRALKKKPGNIAAIEKKKRERNCLICGSVFVPRPAQIRSGRGKFCSQKCNGEARKARIVEHPQDHRALGVTIGRLMEAYS